MHGGGGGGGRWGGGGGVGGGGVVEGRVTSDRPSSLSGKVALSPVVLCYQDKDKLWLLVVHLGVLLRS